MKKLTYILIGVLSSWTSAVGQFREAPDSIFHKGQWYPLYSHPIDSLFKTNPSIKPKSTVLSSNLFRGYVAYYELRNGKLLLNNFKIQIWDSSKNASNSVSFVSVLDKVISVDSDLKASYYSGLLLLAQGKEYYEGLFRDRRYYSFIVIEVRKGEVIEERWFSDDQLESFKRRQFKEFKKTEEYKQVKKEIKERNHSSDFADSFIRDFIIDYTKSFLSLQ